MRKVRKWTGPEIDRLFELREVQKLKWRAIGVIMNETLANCATRYSYYVQKRRTALLQARVRAECADLSRGRPVRRPERVTPKLVEPKPEAKPVRTEQPVRRPKFYHEADSDILSRIDRQGLTAGFLGDPPKGRSALDQKRAGIS